VVHSTYFELYRMRTDRHWLHQKLVACARAEGLQAAAREFRCSRNTVRKSQGRFDACRHHSHHQGAHMLRHSLATTMLRHGASMAQIG
jgi:site-specific recombinase XerD